MSERALPERTFQWFVDGLFGTPWKASPGVVMLAQLQPDGSVVEEPFEYTHYRHRSMFRGKVYVRMDTAGE